MRLRFGNTRFVVVFGNRAYKIGKIRVLRFILRIPFLLLCRELRKRFFTKYGETLGKAMVSDIFAGLIANRVECHYWQNKHDSRVVPIMSVWFTGFVIIQERAEPISIQELGTATPFKTCSIPDTISPRQFGRHHGVVRLLDYGDQRTCAELSRTA